jgi:hypothetical protein
VGALAQDPKEPKKDNNAERDPEQPQNKAFEHRVFSLSPRERDRLLPVATQKPHQQSVREFFLAGPSLLWLGTRV